MSLMLLPPELHGIILTYLCPTEDVHVLHVLNTKFKNSLVEWTKSLEITTYERLFGPHGRKVTQVNNKYHRTDDKPAVEFDSGSKEWWFNNKLHRDNDKPARQLCTGIKEWYVNGEPYRDNGKPCYEYPAGAFYFPLKYV